MDNPGAGERLIDRIGRLARAPLPFSRRQALSVIGGTLAVAAAGGVAWEHRRYLRDTAALHLWLGTPFDREPEVGVYRRAADAIRPLFERKRAPRFGEWLAVYEEPGQTFNAYLRQFTAATREATGPILILPLGSFDARQTRVVADAVEFAALFYGRSVRLLPAEALPPDAPFSNTPGVPPQLLSLPLLAHLKTRVPAEAIALLALTPHDLTPGPGWNFVFGQASLVDRVGVWSLHRLAEARAPAARQLRRVAGVALHEIGHMLGIWHCTAYECCMNGANTQREMDAAPLAFCPECDAKLWWRLRLAPRERYEKLAGCASRHGLAGDALAWSRCAQALGGAAANRATSGTAALPARGRAG